MGRIIELGHQTSSASAQDVEGQVRTFASLRGMVCRSVGPLRHEVSVPFHDSQVRGIALLIETGWDQRWGTDAYWEPGPYLADHLIFRCVRSGIRLIGVDFPIGDRTDKTRLITTGKIPVVDNLCGLTSLPRVGFRFTAIPPSSASNESAVLQAFAEII